MYAYFLLMTFSSIFFDLKQHHIKLNMEKPAGAEFLHIETNLSLN
jgi:hypothetical protein